MKKIAALLACLSLTALSMMADTVEKTEEFHSFNGVSIGENFNVTLREGRRYQVIVKVDKRLADYCSINLQNGIVSVDVDSKRIPKEIKQVFKKDNMPSFDAVITVPTSNMLSSITLKQNAVLTGSQVLTLHGDTRIEVTDNASIKTLKLSCEKLTVVARKKSVVEAMFACNNFELSTANSASATIRVETKKAETETDGSSKLNLNITANELFTSYSNFSKIVLKGNVDKLTLQGKGGAELNAQELKVPDVEANLTGTTCLLAPIKTLSLELSNNAKLTFDNDPKIIIKKVTSSSIFRGTRTE